MLDVQCSVLVIDRSPRSDARRARSRKPDTFEMSADTTNNAPVLTVRNLTTCLDLDEGQLVAVDGLSLTLRPRRTLGLIGESGCGKSMAAKSILRILPKPGRIATGEILLREGETGSTDIAKLSDTGRPMRAIRGGRISMIFQEPMTSLSPVHSVGDQVCEMIRQHVTRDRAEARQRAVDMLTRVKISRPAERMKEYPHQLSGGLRQRVMIAMALACHPDLLIADEPTTALDVTVQAQILRLVKELQEEMGMSVLFITHDLGIIARVADEVAVMYLGQIVEQGSKVDIYRRPRHPYTRGLMAAVPRPGKGRRQRLPAIKGTVPLPINLPSRCRFFERCPLAKAGVCDSAVPELKLVGAPRDLASREREIGEGGRTSSSLSHAPAAQGGGGRGTPHRVRCFRAGEIA